MLNGLSWNPGCRKKKGGSREGSAKLVALTALKLNLPEAPNPSRGLRVPKRLRLRLRSSLNRYYRKPPVVLALINSLLHSGVRTPECVPPKPTGGFPRLVPIYLRVSKASKPTRAALRFFYLYIANPSSAVVTFSKAPSLWILSPYGGLVKSPFNPL